MRQKLNPLEHSLANADAFHMPAAEGRDASLELALRGLLGEDLHGGCTYSSADISRFTGRPPQDRNTVYFFERPLENFDKDKVYVYRFDDTDIANFHPETDREKADLILVDDLFHDDDPCELELVLESLTWDVISRVFEEEPRYGPISPALSDPGRRHMLFFNSAMLELAITHALGT
jgi:hypothetical protein